MLVKDLIDELSKNGSVKLESQPTSITALIDDSEEETVNESNGEQAQVVEVNNQQKELDM